MSPSLKLLCHTNLAVTVVQASLLPFEPIGSTKALLRTRGLNATQELNGDQRLNTTRRLDAAQGLNATRKTNTTIAGSKVFLAGPGIPPHSSAVFTQPVQHVQLDVSAPPVVQTCENGTGSIVVQDCTCSVQELAAQAIDDALTMVKAVKGLWGSTMYQTILYNYMGGPGHQSCLTPEASDRINRSLENLADVKEYSWLPYDTRWSSDYSGDLSVYCAAGLPPRQSSFFAQCQDQFSMGWAYASYSEQKYSSFIGFCSNSGFVSRVTMLEQLQAGKITLGDKSLGSNYGRAALSLLLQLSPYINDRTEFSGYGYGEQLYGYSEVFNIAKNTGCDTSKKNDISSLDNADNWALWISTLYFTVQMTPSPSSSGTSSSSLDPVINSGCSLSPACPLTTNDDCETAVSRYDNNTMYSQYTSHWASARYSEGCTAIFQCAFGYPAGGISGADIKDYFMEIYAPTADGGAGCGVGKNALNHPCGWIYLANGCGFKFDECLSGFCKTCSGTSCHHP